MFTSMPKDWFIKGFPALPRRQAGDKAGQSLVEILVAISIFVLSMTAAFQLIFGGQSLSVDAANAQLAADYAQEGTSAVRTVRDREWAELMDGNHGLVFQNNEWMFGSTSVSDTKDIFTRTISVSTINENVKIATTTVTWQVNSGRLQKIEAVEQLTNWGALSYSSCRQENLTGDWSRPVSIGSADLGSGNQGTDVLAKLPYAFVSGVSSTASKPDIFSFNVSSPSSPTLADSLNIGAGGINSIYIKGNYLYAASANDSKELIIFDISDPNNMVEAGSLSLSGSTDAMSVIVFENTAAVGRLSAASSEIAFINVSDPAYPTLIRGDSSNDGDVRDFAISGNILYVISKQSDEDVWLYNITDTLNPIRIGYHDIEGTTEDLSIFVQYRGGANLLVGNTEGELVALGATSTVDKIYVRDRINLGGDVNDIVCVVGNLAFLATSNSGKEFVIVNTNNLDSMAEYASLNYPQVATGIDFADNKVFMSVRSNDSLRIITSQ